MAGGLNHISNLISTLPPQTASSFAEAAAGGSFDPYLDDAMKKLDQVMKQRGNISDETIQDSEFLAQVLNENELEAIEQRLRQDRQRVVPSDVNPLALQTNRLQVPPFQIMIDKSVEALENISQLEFRVNDLTEQYIEGKVSIDEVTIEANKLNLAISFATTVISTASSTLKELTQMAV